MNEDPLKKLQSAPTEFSPSNELEFPVKILDLNNPNTWEQVAPGILELENKAWEYDPPLDLDDLKKLVKGAIVGVIYSEGKIVGNVMTRVEAEPNGNERIVKRLPLESLKGDGTAVLPDFRGRELQKILLLSRLDLARQLKKETILSYVLSNNGASLKNIINTGARILAYFPDYFKDNENPARLVWENDLVIPSMPDEKIEKKEGKFPDIIIEIQSGDKVDIKAKEALAKILSEDYIGISVQSGGSDGVKALSNTRIMFRHLSNFPPDTQTRLRERKKKIQEIVKI